MLFKLLPNGHGHFAYGFWLLWFCCRSAVYKGKTLNIVVNYAVGGPTDIEARLVGRHLAKHIPGQPVIVVNNMAGAGGIVGHNYLGEVAKADGLTMGYFTSQF